jgi:hypothetical protein
MRISLAWLTLTLVVFAPSLSAGFVWDDHALIERDSRIHTLPPLGELLRMPFFPGDLDEARAAASDGPRDAGNAFYYRPLLKLMHALEFQAFGLDPLGYHAINWLLHACNVLLALTWLRRRLAGSTSALEGVPAADSLLALGVALAVIPFALHPSRVLAVTWVSGGGDLLAGLFVLICLITWQKRELGRAAVLTLVVSFVAATLAKEAGVAVLAVLATETRLLVPRSEYRPRLRILALLGATELGVLALRAWAVPAQPRGPLADGVLALLSRVSISFGFELKALVLPIGLRHQLNYSLGTPATLPADVQALGALGLVAGAVLVAFIAIALWRSRGQGQADGRHGIAADLALIGLLLAPGLNVVMIGSQGGTLSERYLYMPMLGVSALCGRGLVRWLAARGRLPGVALAALMAIIYAAACVHEIGHLQSERTLYGRFVAQDPRELFSINGLLREAVRRGDRPLARACNALRLCVISGGLGEERLAAPVNERQQAALFDTTLDFLESELNLTSDSEQPRLLELRAMLDELASDAPAAKTWKAYRLIGAPADPAAASASGRAHMGSLRAIAYARTLEPERAAAILGDPTDAEERVGNGSIALRSLWRARIAVALGDSAGARAVLDRAGSLVPTHIADALRAAIPAPSSCDDEAALLAHARALAFAGLPGLARKRLVSCEGRSSMAAALVAIEIDLADGRPDHAHAKLSQLAVQRASLAPDQMAQAQQLVEVAQGLLEQQAQNAALEQPCSPCSQLSAR